MNGNFALPAREPIILTSLSPFFRPKTTQCISSLEKTRDENIVVRSPRAKTAAKP